MLLHGFTQMMSGDIDGAADTWRAVLAVDPANAVANAALAAHYLRLGDALLALPLLEKAQEGGINVTLAGGVLLAGEPARYLQVNRQGWPLRRGSLAESPDPVAGPDPAGCRRKASWPLETSMGSLECELFWDKAPVTVGNSSACSRNAAGRPHRRTRPGHYDGTVLHRVIRSS